MPGADATDIHASSRPEGGPGNAVVTAMAAVAKSAQNREVSPAEEQQKQQHIVVVSHNLSSKREKNQTKKMFNQVGLRQTAGRCRNAHKGGLWRSATGSAAASSPWRPASYSSEPARSGRPPLSTLGSWPPPWCCRSSALRYYLCRRAGSYQGR